MAETTYYKNKVYIPRAVRESLGLADGDKLYIRVLDKGVAQLILIRGSEADKRILEKIFMKILLDTNIPVHAYIEPHRFTEKLQIKLLHRDHINDMSAAVICFRILRMRKLY